MIQSRLVKVSVSYLVAIPNLDREQALHARFKTLRRRLRKHAGLSETAHWNLCEMR